jgi:hypothetical protein
MAEDDRLIRDLYAESAAVPSTDHPDDATWEAMALAALPAARRAKVLDHVARCAQCAQIYRGLKILATEAAAFDPAVPRTPSRRVLAWPSRWVYGGLAAAAAVLLVMWLPLRHTGSPAPSASPDQVRSPVKATPVPLEPTGRVTDAPRAFRWQPVAGAVRYRVELLDGQGNPLWSSAPLEGTAVEWPPTVPRSPGRYYWQVVALPDPAQPLAAPAASALVSFEIAEP